MINPDRIKNPTWLKFEQHLRNEGVTNSRLDKLRSEYCALSRHIKIPLEKLTRDDIEEYIEKLATDKIKRKKGKPYSATTKLDYKKFLKQFFKWYKGDGIEYPPEVKWIKTRIAKDQKPQEKETVSYTEVQRLSNRFKRPDMRLLTLLLFDSGFRISEMLSVKKRDLTWENFEKDQKCFWILCNESKTYQRKVPVPLFTEDIKNYLNSAYYTDIKDEAPLFRLDYNSYRKTLMKYSKELFLKKISPHSLRHSSATYYAREYDGNLVLIAERYGWSFSSKELKTYVRRSGVYQRAGVKKVYSNELEVLKAEMEDQRKEIDLLKGQNARLLVAFEKALSLKDDEKVPLMDEFIDSQVKKGKWRLEPREKKG